MESLDELSRRVSGCIDCPLHSGRTNAVPGEGPADAEILFIGEGPGYHEDRQGRPFVGAAGSFLEDLLQSIGMSREQVFIANMVKCRPPNNRDPVPAEIAACSKYLDRQIELINPLLIITLGRFATARFLPGQSISRVRGRLRAVGGRHIFPIMHPAAGLRRQEMRAAIEEDFAKVPGLLDVLRMQAEPPAPVAGAIREGQPAYAAEAEPAPAAPGFGDVAAGQADGGEAPAIAPAQRGMELEGAAADETTPGQQRLF